jgi:copper oxidase (laccase) domain-containing protein
VNNAVQAEFFAPLSAAPNLVHAFSGREPGIDVRVDRDEALRRLDESHRRLRAQLGLGERAFATARQVHGRAVAVARASNAHLQPEADALITDDPGVCLGIYVADCCAVYLADPVRRAAGLVHSGRKGSELGAARAAIEAMQAEFGCEPGRMIAQLSPCIRPPHYEVDFAAMILAQCREAGVKQVYDCETCTACHPERYYSYRMEQGRTGRMVALLGLA